MDVEGEVARILAGLRDLADPVRAEHERRYLKSAFAHIGVPVPALRGVVVSAVREPPARGDLLALAAALWTVEDAGRPVHEARMAAVEVLVKRVKVLEPGDVEVAERLILDSASWVYVDNLADRVAGALVLREPGLGAVLDDWAADPYLWVRRSALLALLPGVRTGAPDLARITRFGDALIGEKEFFIRKALGWVLREQSKKDPAWVADWIEARIADVSGVTFREAVRHLPDGDAARLTAAYRAQAR
ncbi:DNA alkylation repair protein [Actinomadura algeriensis]|uniref:3-methyladenine DNA glycosylase AlkD n=1 Tax=Actinomadura algeriensis TaxID=1679523 RepID=A0ABR9JLZ9_9ACTN|nr:DNA alkylation repair protein [Actinomadura algeriensis]MBE1531464.1 3-methyladenine DNA glycosylase AlkD [Actinomadura algeriensis]